MHREPVTDAAKRRREYLLRRARAQVCLNIFTSLSALLWVPALFGFLVTLILLVRATVPGYSGSSLSAAIWFVFTVLCGGAAYLCIRVADSARHKARTLEYVPPVVEQIAALPARNVLLRGSEAPAVAAGELLTAAHGGAGIREELMRATSVNESGT